ncbi:UNVERIFIED_CONTAM: Retrovirus-related Pol polyprotein from transposon RE1 [Sesamum angustifolium]|uniref:Retrovirus-related Pol polyprotein from transposon RE1 n=1 Tax=Sesamum angustifolium TaxID=2727405 RepID=A0AAW2KMZ8_9LAMI
MPTGPLQVYSRRNRSTNTTLTVPPGLPPTAAPRNPSATPIDDLPIALRKDGTLERYKARLVAKVFTQTYRVDYFETFSPVSRLNSIRVLFSLEVNLNWTMYQMDIKNVFLYGDLNGTVYMEQPPGYVAQGRSNVWVLIQVKIEAYSNADYTGVKDDRKSTSEYCTYVGEDLVTWRSKKQTTVARSSAEAKYRAMAHTTSEILWLKNLLKELGFMHDDPVPMHYDNQAAIHIASNPIFHERTKHIEVDCHFVREAVMSQKICTPFTPSSEQRTDNLPKP